uniref:Uncharacterized protein n=1 Tax=Nymphaea colorata TaxID=210225 RepID=A0A5K0ZS43_9MAGN
MVMVVGLAFIRYFLFLLLLPLET